MDFSECGRVSWSKPPRLAYDDVAKEVGSSYMSANAAYFRKHLGRQLGFLRRSCRSYDEGFPDEAIRIATVIRVLVHDTANCTSLLTHLNARTIKILDSGSPPVEPSSPGGRVFGFRFGMIRPTPLGGEFAPNLALDPGFIRFLVVADWWDQELISGLEGRTYTRRSIVLSAADKDGGAHVDRRLDADYEALAEDGSLATFYVQAPEGTIERGTRDVHLACLRQMGNELLHSPELLELADGT